MPYSGLFITLFDEMTLRLYLDRGVYGFHMRPEQEPSVRSRHYAALADYGCAREGTHIFFFLERRIVYGGQVIGSSEHGAFYMNGQESPLGKRARSKLVWDESKRKKYSPTQKPGIFTRPEVNKSPVCQPYLLLFEDKLGLGGNSILSDALYFELGEFPYPLPTNSISGMGFCTMTPAEVSSALRLVREEPSETFETHSDERIELLGEPQPFLPEYGITDLKDSETEAQLEASCLANPNLLPSELRPGTATLCRQVPISPFKPFQMDRADISYYSDDSIAYGSIPNAIIELKNRTVRLPEADQVLRYVRWLRKRVGEDSRRIKVSVLAPSYSANWNSRIPQEYRDQIESFAF